MKLLKQIILIILSIAYIVISIIVGNKQLNGEVSGYTIYLIIIYVPFLILMIINKRVYANIILGIYMIIEFVTVFVRMIMFSGSMDSITMTKYLYVQYIAYFVSLFLSLLIIVSIIKEFILRKTNNYYLLILIASTMYLAISLYLFINNKDMSILVFIQTTILLLIELIYLYTKEIVYMPKEEKKYTVEELLNKKVK